MKKYFVSFSYILERGFEGFANCFRTSLDGVDLKQLRLWETEIRESSNGVERVDILFFKEIK